MNNFINRISFQTIIPLLLTAFIGMGVIMFVATEKLKSNVYDLEKEKIEDFAKEIEYLIKGDFKILFYTYGDNKDRYESAANASKDQLLNKIKEVIGKRKNRFAVVIKEGNREILKENLASMKNSETIVTKREFKPFKWEIEVYMDLASMNKTITQNNNIVSLVILFMTLANIGVLFFVFRNKIIKPFRVMLEYLQNVEKGYVPLAIESSYEIDRLAKGIDAMASKIKKREAELDRSYNYTKNILDSQSSIVVITNGNTIVDANRKLFDFLGDCPNLESFRKKYDCICDLFEDIEKDDYIRSNEKDIWIKELLEHNHKRYKAKIRGQIFSIGASRLDEERVIIVLSEITELELYKNNLELMVSKEVEKNLKKEQQIMQQKKYAALGELLINIAHHWRQPLNTSVLMLHSIVDHCEEMGVETSEISDTARMMESEIMFLSETINQFSSIYSKNGMTPYPVNVASAIKNSIQFIGSKLSNVTVVFESLDEHLILVGIEDDLHKCVSSLILNSLEIFEERKIEHPKILISATQIENGIAISIEDNGGGIKEELLEKIFEPYFTTKFKARGKGMGLYLLKNVVEIKYSGSISLQNTGEGVRFNIVMMNG